MPVRKKTVTKIRKTRSFKSKTTTKPKQSSLFSESYVSLALGVVAVIVATVLLLSFFHKPVSKPVIQTPDQPQASKTVNRAIVDTYSVKPGDSLWTIAEDKYQDGYKWVVIAKANNLVDPGTIHKDDKLVIPPVTEKAIAGIQTQAQLSVTGEQNSEQISGATYTVAKGDNLWNIAVRAYGDGYQWTKIADANHLANPRVIHSGNILEMPR